jgi:hypothetical protein
VKEKQSAAYNGKTAGVPLVTEVQWLTCTDPNSMLEFLRGRATERKLRLFAVACCRHISHIIDAQGHRAIAVAEQQADGECGVVKTLWTTIRTQVNLVLTFNVARPPQDHPAAALAAASLLGCDVMAVSHACAVAAFEVDAKDAKLRFGPAWLAAKDEADRALARATYDTRVAAARESAPILERQANALRDIFGNPFCAVTMEPSWLAASSGTIVNLAKAIYDERAFDRMPILADALEDAGCTDQDVLLHCRSGGDHVRGCWVVDLLTGKG